MATHIACPNCTRLIDLSLRTSGDTVLCPCGMEHNIYFHDGGKVNLISRRPTRRPRRKKAR